MQNIKIAKAFRTLSHEASCALAAVRHSRLAVQEKVELIRQVITTSSAMRLCK